VAMGHRAAAIFVIQREDVHSFTPHETADPEFGQAFRHALSVGVEAFAYKCRVTDDSIELADLLPMEL
ncbi:MAG: DNA/RNA nuclease SfsA, partial [Chloroflexota bacterium]|nr:DNA/RNA nuclease SfsA [Chloroflexota bacterium]